MGQLPAKSSKFRQEGVPSSPFANAAGADVIAAEQEKSRAHRNAHRIIGGIIAEKNGLDPLTVSSDLTVRVNLGDGRGKRMDLKKAIRAALKK